jgi:hypothetical protein
MGGAMAAKDEVRKASKQFYAALNQMINVRPFRAVNGMWQWHEICQRGTGFRR